MFQRYGPQFWWPAESWFEMMVGAVLTQATSWANVEHAIENLKKADVLTPSKIRNIGEDELALLIYPSGFYKAKAKKLKALAEFVGLALGDDLESAWEMDLESIRSILLTVHGIGNETADDILVYALNKPFFIIDTYTKRMFHRLGLTPQDDSYDSWRMLFMDNLPSDTSLFGEYHALIVRHNKETCSKSPKCNGCCLLGICPTGKSIVA